MCFPHIAGCGVKLRWSSTYSGSVYDRFIDSVANQGPSAMTCHGDQCDQVTNATSSQSYWQLLGQEMAQEGHVGRDGQEGGDDFGVGS